MMTEFMSDNVGLGEISRGFELSLEFIEERKIKIQVVVAGTIERAARRA